MPRGHAAPVATYIFSHNITMIDNNIEKDKKGFGEMRMRYKVKKKMKKIRRD